MISMPQFSGSLGLLKEISPLPPPNSRWKVSEKYCCINPNWLTNCVSIWPSSCMISSCRSFLAFSRSSFWAFKLV